MPRFLMDGRLWIDLTDDQIALARMALADFKLLGDPHTAAIRLLHKEFSLTLTHAVGAVAYAQQHLEVGDVR